MGWTLNKKSIPGELHIYDYQGDVFELINNYSADLVRSGNWAHQTGDNSDADKKAKELQKSLSSPSEHDIALEKYVSKNVKSLINRRVSASIQGFGPHIPNVLKNHPMSMLNKTSINHLSDKVIELDVSIEANWSTSNDKLVNAALTTYFALKVLQGIGYNVNLNFMFRVIGDGDLNTVHRVAALKSSSKLNSKSFITLFKYWDKLFRGVIFTVLRSDLRKVSTSLENTMIPYGRGLGSSTIWPSFKEKLDKFYLNNALVVCDGIDYFEFKEITDEKTLKSNLLYFGEKISDKKIKENFLKGVEQL